MLLIREKVEQDAASRLALPKGRLPSQELARYKGFLKVANARVKILHKGGGSGMEVCALRAVVLDILIRHILKPIQADLEARGIKVPQFSLVAIGGYGRAVLNVFSDIDIMILHDGDMVSGGKAAPGLSALTDGLLYTLWDVGLKVGHSVRGLEDVVAVANADMQSKTSLIEARLVLGDAGLFERFQAVLLTKCVRGFEDAYIQARIEDQATRRSKHGNSPFMQEPNIKNGCGGLRDFQNLLWMAYFKHRAHTLAELKEKGMVTDSELKQLEVAYDYLLRVRNEIHYTLKRPVDVLSKNIQPTIATNMGFSDRSPSRRLEMFMRVVFTHMRNIHIISRTLEQRLALVPSPPGRLATLRGLFSRAKGRKAEQVVDGFRIVDGEIQESVRSFKDQPRRLMRVFLHAQQRGLRLHPDLAQGIRNNLALVDRSFLEDPHVRDTFLEILGARGNVAPTLRAMHEVGFLGKYIPEFGKLTCLVQHEFFHQYTADEHTLVCVEKLDQVWSLGNEQNKRHVELFNRLSRPWLLYLALLLHDCGKGDKRAKHTVTGPTLALKAARRLKLDRGASQSLALIVRHHLLMIQISQRRDMEDERVIQTFVGAVQFPENLDMLTLHTYADSLGTSDTLWNGFKDSLLWTLYHKARAWMEGSTEVVHKREKVMQKLRSEVKALLPATFSPDEIDAHFEHLPERYFKIHTPREIANDLTMAHRFMHLQLMEEDRALEPVVQWHNDNNRGFTSVHICTWDRLGLFAKVAGALSASGFNILSASIFSRRDGIILDTFFVTDAQQGGLATKTGRERFEKVLNEALDINKGVDFPAVLSKMKLANRLYAGLEGETIPLRISFDNQSSDDYTVIDVETEDRVGLLYFMVDALAGAKLDVALAKISTEKGAAIDSFYVRTLEKARLEDPAAQRRIEKRLRATILALGAKP